MGKETDPLQGIRSLVERASKYSHALVRVRETSSNLGAGSKPAYLSYEAASGLDLASRVSRVAQIRETISAKTIPLLENHRTGIVGKIKSGIQEQVVVYEQYYRSGLLTRKERNLAKKRLRSLEKELYPAKPESDTREN